MASFLAKPAFGFGNSVRLCQTAQSRRESSQPEENVDRVNERPNDDAHVFGCDHASRERDDVTESNRRERDELHVDSVDKAEMVVAEEMDQYGRNGERHQDTDHHEAERSLLSRLLREMFAQSPCSETQRYNFYPWQTAKHNQSTQRKFYLYEH